MDRDNGDKDNFVFFFGCDSVFSQFYPCKFEEGGRVFCCTEQYMHFHKAVTFGDDAIAKRIMATQSPWEHKRLGRQVRNFSDVVWTSRSVEIVLKGNMLKFSQNPRLKDELLSTIPRELVEANPYDRIWGVGLTADDPRITDKSQWKGLNTLGKLLLQVGDKLKNEQN